MDSLERLFDQASSNSRKVELALELGFASKHGGDAIAYALLAEEIATGISKPQMVHLWSESAELHAKASRYEAAALRMLKVVDYYRLNGNQSELALALRTAAGYQKDAVNLDEALVLYTEAEQVYKKLNNTEGVIDCINTRGIIHKDLHNYSQALPLYHQAYDLARKKDLPLKLAATCVNIGVVLKNEEHFDEALNYYRKAEEIYIDQSDFNGLANIYNNIGNIYRLQKKLSKSLDYFELALINRRKSGNLMRLSYTYNNIGIVYTEQKKYKLALEMFSRAEDEKIELKDYATLASTYLNISEVYLATNDELKYYYYADLAEKLARRYALDEIVRDIRVNHGRFEANNGNYKRAYGHLSHVFQEMDTLDEKSQRILTSVLQAHFREKQSQNEISELSIANGTLSDEKLSLEQQQRVSRTLIWLLLGVLLILILTSFLLLRNRRFLKEQKRLLEETNEQLRRTTLGKEEKETLLKEIHHRVKNNLQIIKSLIRLQKAGLEDARLIDILQEFEQRVSAMALVHESLYKSNDLTSVNVSSYYENLIKDLITAYKVRQNIQSKISVNIGDLGLDTLVPLGLLTNEIISNSLKHAFKDGENGIITVDLKKIEGNRFELLIGDNGKGFNFEDQRAQESTLGTELIVALIEQLDGKYEFINDNGAFYKITFEPQEKTTR
ncbi:MAG: hypothetical protein A3D92_19715 [Bacteroidetes bacterium RIFCSPHIGHO2_02_FULL_44_7]|nr:MAG: hypothetical protein A3D92_19715 [Bacteroidetes bacterium RIFCSPHIGHO2_02_FULL_44_7]